MLLDGDVAVEEEIGVRGRVVEPVELPELLPGELRDRLGVAAGIEPVGVVGEEVLLQGLEHQRLGRRVGPLHLVVDDPRDGEAARRVVGVGEFQVMPLLLEGLPQDAGPEHEVRVDPGEVEVVDGDLARHGVDRLVGVGEGVDEGLQRGPRQLVEGVLHGVSLGARQDRVLQDVGDARGVPGGRSEPDGEEVLAVAAVEVQRLRPRGEVFHLVGRAADVADGLDPPDDEAVQGLSLSQPRGRGLCRLFHKHLDGTVFDAGRFVRKKTVLETRERVKAQSPRRVPGRARRAQRRHIGRLRICN